MSARFEYSVIIGVAILGNRNASAAKLAIKIPGKYPFGKNKHLLGEATPF
jgi:hypothetical protein